MKKILFIIVFLFIEFWSVSFAKAAEVEITSLDANATGYATFQSHNQKVVSNRYGIFTTHLHSANIPGPYDSNVWYLSRSTDGGKTFTTVYQSTPMGTSSPAMETDSWGNIYVIHPDWSGGKSISLFYRFLATNNFTDPVVTIIPNTSHGKYAMVIDETKGQFYYFSANNSFTVISMDGQVKKSYTLTQQGSSAYMQYPQLYLDKNGVLYAAWTTQKNDNSLYWDIHVMKSPDSGNSWQKLNGTALSVPVVCDETGPTDRIILDDEFNLNTWLWTMISKNGKIHFAYAVRSTPWKQHYVRFDLATGQRDKDIYPVWKGETISLLNQDGFCTTKQADNNFPIYCISQTSDSRIGVLVSYDNGNSWQDYATSIVLTGGIYASGGYREITSDGYIIGTFTDAKTPPGANFFKVNVGQLEIQGDIDKNGKVDIYDYNLLVSDFGKSGQYNADINSDGKVDIYDYNILVTNFSKTAS